MTEVKAHLRYYRVAPRKVRLVASLIRGQSVNDALKQLAFSRKKSAPALNKLLKSAIANARNNFKLDPSNLYIKKITVNGGTILKRWMPRARGRATIIRKKTSHITLVLDTMKSKEKTKI